jgi:hypothetical protein
MHLEPWGTSFNAGLNFSFVGFVYGLDRRDDTISIQKCVKQVFAPQQFMDIMHQSPNGWHIIS